MVLMFSTAESLQHILAGGRRGLGGREVRVGQGSLGCDPPAGVILQELLGRKEQEDVVWVQPGWGEKLPSQVPDQGPEPQMGCPQTQNRTKPRPPGSPASSGHSWNLDRPNESPRSPQATEAESLPFSGRVPGPSLLLVGKTTEPHVSGSRGLKLSREKP